MLRSQLPGTGAKRKAKLITQPNHYELLELLGQGTFGKVYSALDRKSGQRVAIKEVKQDNRYKNRQLDVISRLDHDNVIFMRDYYFINKKQDKYLYIVMDYYPESLQGLLRTCRKEKKVLEEGARKVVAFQLFKALSYLESNNVCHRDLKPPNILVDPETLEVRVCDFGSAKIFQKIQKNVAYICSRYYRAPELLFSYTYYKTEIDVWSAGCILAELLTCEPVFPGDSALEQVIEIFKILGTPSKQYMKKYAEEVNEFYDLPEVPAAGWGRVLKRYSPDPNFIDLLTRILTYDVDQRAKPIDVLKHKYFHDLTDSKYEHIVKKLPNLFDFTRLRTPKNAKHIDQLQSLFRPTWNKLDAPYLHEGQDTAHETPQQQLELRSRPLSEPGRNVGVAGKGDTE